MATAPGTTAVVPGAPYGWLVWKVAYRACYGPAVRLRYSPRVTSEPDMLPNVSSLPAWLVPSVYLNWSEDWLGEAVAIASRGHEHRLPGGADGPQRGDVVVTVVGSEPGIVAAVELMGASKGEDWVSDEVFGPEKPVVWDDLFNGAAAYARSSGCRSRRTPRPAPSWCCR